MDAVKMWTIRALCVLFYCQVAKFSDPECVIELLCAECVPEHMPLVTSPGVANGSVALRSGERVALSCGAGRFLLYPHAAALEARCEAGRYRVPHDVAPRRLLDLGCRESVLEDVAHPVEHCGGGRQGRAYRTREEGGRTMHLATLCFDEERAVAAWLLTSTQPGGVPLPPHSDAVAPLSLLGNFEHMLDAGTRRDAERLYSDDARLDRRLRELFKHERYCFAEQTLATAELLSARYFEDRFMGASGLSSNRVASWSGVVRGNLRHVHGDVAALLRHHRAAGAGHELLVYAGTHGVVSLSAAEGAGAGEEAYLAAGRRFPVPRYLWTAVVWPARGRGLAVVVLNDPLVRVSSVREAVFCSSACGAARWLPRLQRHRNYERPAAGLVFCCALPEFAARVTEMPPVFNATIEPLY